MDQAGEVRIEDAARLLGSASAEEARATLGELVYDEPGTGRLVPAAEYLSGKVRAKLREAGQAAEDDPRLDVNAAALRRALPDDLGPGEIDARLGASWIDWRYVQQGLREILEDPRLKVEKGHGTSWTVTGDKASVLATQVWGTEDKDAVTLAACLLEQRPVKVSPERSERDDTPHEKHQKRLQAAAATVTARAKADELNRRFGDWLWENPARAADLVKTYNERFDSLVLRSYDGARPALPGLAAWFREWVHPHQLAAVARIINEPAVLLAHDVGAGKTAEMAMGAMELRRLGLAAKPAIVVPNHMLEQFQREFLQLYPHARVLAAGSDDLKALGRHTFTARIATGNWDAVIMS
jgi:N12 class adenine-specific DNA methylase